MLFPMIALCVLVGVFLVVVILYGMLTYNKLVKYRVETENAWSQIDVQLKRRYDLIPNLVETVKGVMSFEKETLVKVMEARGRAMGAGGDATPERMKAEGEISGFLGRLMAVWENYPDLKSNQNAAKLQEELTTTENRISYTRGHYNDIVSNFNMIVQMFPANVVAGFFNFKSKEFFEAPEEEKPVPKVQF
jgi:LemA protein